MLRLLENTLAGDPALNGALDGKRDLTARRRTAHVISRILVDNRASSQHTVVEINGRDRPGLLYDIGSALSQLGLSIVTAHISTYGAQAVDVFYVKDRFGLQVTKDAEIERVRARLLTALDEPELSSNPVAVTAAAE